MQHDTKCKIFLLPIICQNSENVNLVPILMSKNITRNPFMVL